MDNERIAVSELHDKRCFDPKILAWGDSGVGKTHMFGNYSHGPLHIYAFDQGTHKTIVDLPGAKNATIKYYQEAPTIGQMFANFWMDMQTDNDNGVFKDLAANNGVVIVDSLTTMAIACMEYVMKSDNFTKPTPEIQHYGKQMAYLQRALITLTNLPCAAVITAHIDYVKDKNGNAIKAYPAITGKLQHKGPAFFDEMYYMDVVGGKHITNFIQSSLFAAKSRLVKDTRSIKNFSLDTLFEIYMLGKSPEDY